MIILTIKTIYITFVYNSLKLCTIKIRLRIHVQKFNNYNLELSQILKNLKKMDTHKRPKFEQKDVSSSVKEN